MKRFLWLLLGQPILWLAIGLQAFAIALTDVLDVCGFEDEVSAVIEEAEAS